MEALIFLTYLYLTIGAGTLFGCVIKGHDFDSIIIATAWPLFWAKAVWRLLREI